MSHWWIFPVWADFLKFPKIYSQIAFLKDNFGLKLSRCVVTLKIIRLHIHSL
jgi:hypothetical protein